MSVCDLAAYMPEPLASKIIAEQKHITEIRLRAGRTPQLVGTKEEWFSNEPMPAQDLRRIAVAMMEHSYYSRENELSRGYFTMRNGCRVGVCGSFVEKQPGIFVLRSIGSLCIRIARAVPGCAKDVVAHICAGGLNSALILSRPGLGKTTLLRDAAHQLSAKGYTVGIADERHEIAACCDAVPTMDVGIRTDVVDGCTKAQAMEHLIRAMSPRIIITDEIGNKNDIAAVTEAARMGIHILASAHAASFAEFESGSVGTLVRNGLFPIVFLLEGTPGQIAQIRRYDRGGNAAK